MESLYSNLTARFSMHFSDFIIIKKLYSKNNFTQNSLNKIEHSFAHTVHKLKQTTTDSWPVLQWVVYSGKHTKKVVQLW